MKMGMKTVSSEKKQYIFLYIFCNKNSIVKFLTKLNITSQLENAYFLLQIIHLGKNYITFLVFEAEIPLFKTCFRKIIL
jgi:hypothetical protein